MGIMDVLGFALRAAGSVADYMNNKQIQEYVKKMYELEMDLKKELDKLPNTDDLKIQSLWKELGITMRAYETQQKLLSAAKN